MESGYTGRMSVHFKWMARLWQQIKKKEIVARVIRPPLMGMVQEWLNQPFSHGVVRPPFDGQFGGSLTTLLTSNSWFESGLPHPLSCE